jgi:hypothetical protein
VQVEFVGHAPASSPHDGTQRPARPWFGVEKPGTDASFVPVTMIGSSVSQNHPAGHSLPPTVQKVEQKPLPEVPTKQLHAAGVVVLPRSAVVHAAPSFLVGAVTVVRQRPDVVSHFSAPPPAPLQSESAVHPPRQ